MQSTLLAISPLDGRYQEKLAPLSALFSEYGLIKARVTIEIRWLQTLATKAKLPPLACLGSAENHFLNQIVEHFSLQDALYIKQLETITQHDMKAVEYFIKRKLSTTMDNRLASVSEFIHFGCTSEDINNLAYGILLDAAREQCLLPALTALLAELKQLASQSIELPMLSRTHGQAATPTTLGKEIANVIARLERQLVQCRTLPILAKFNGATGNYNALAIAYPSINWPVLCQSFVTNQFKLTWNPYTTQIEPHDAMAELLSVLLRINTILIDFNRDMWGYLSLGYFTQQVTEQSIGSSIMPHKVNPIHFENAEGNLGLSNALCLHMMTKLPISRWQRDLSDSTVQRNLGVAIGHALLAYQATLQGLQQVTPNSQIIAADLAHHWEILGEAIQTIMRRYQCMNAYEALKDLTRGKSVNQASMHAFIQTLSLPEEAKETLLALTPGTYTGYATKLAREILDKQ